MNKMVGFKTVRLLVILLCFSSFIYGQNKLKGLVLEEKSKAPVSFATVYINGTTKSAITNENGSFTIANVSTPCLLVVSCVGYEPQMETINKVKAEPLTLLLHAKASQLSEVVVMGKSHRDKYLTEFKNRFLGTDRWGKKAILRNDSDLIFSQYTDTSKKDRNFLYINALGYGSIDEQYTQWLNDNNTDGSYSVKANVPLIVDLPLLGYTVYIHLVDFTLLKTNGQEWRCLYKGYYYYKPYETTSKHDLYKYEKNREEVYYNSSMHFLRSLYNNNLMQNGFLSVNLAFNNLTGKLEKRYNDIVSFIGQKNSDLIQIEGLKNEVFTIYYFSGSDGKPLDLDKVETKNSIRNSKLKLWDRFTLHASQQEQFSVEFLDNDCAVRSNGTFPNNDIVFSGEISTSVGTRLPDDYQPKGQDEDIQPFSGI